MNTLQVPYYSDPTFTPIWEIGKNTKLHSIPDFELINHRGETLSKTQLKNKVFVVNFFFTACPGICSDMMNNLSLIAHEFKENDQVTFLSHTVTPSEDTPQQLNTYLKKLNGLNLNWHLLTGDRDTIYQLGRRSYFIEEDLGLKKNNDEFLHTENLVVIDQNGHIRGIFNGLNQTSLKQMKEDIKKLLDQD